MKIKNEFVVAAPIEQAWSTVMDLERIAPCLPGASINGQDGDEYRGSMKVKIGPITASYDGTVRFEQIDEDSRRAVLQADGRDARGQGTASATIVSSMQGHQEGTKVEVETDMRLTGRAAQFGRGVAQDIATRMLDQFAACLEQEITAQDRRVPEDSSERRGTETGPASQSSASGDDSVGQRTEAFDLGAAGGQAVLKRVLPVAAVLAVIILVGLWFASRRHTA